MHATVSSTNSTPFFNHQNTVEDDHAAESIRQILVTLVDRCQVPSEAKLYDQALHDECILVAKKCGYPMGTGTDVPSLLPFLGTGVHMASTCFRHLPSDATRVFIALYTAFGACIDDVLKQDVDSLMLFHPRLMRNERHGHPVLDGFAHLLAGTEMHFDRFAANLIVTDSLCFIDSIIIDHTIDGLNVSKNAVGLATFMRLMSGISSAYMMFIFPAEIPLRKYVQAIPEMRNFISYLNDVMSFYKEEMCGEDVNYVSLLAASRGVDKLTVLAGLAGDVVQDSDVIKAILKDEPDALHAWVSFMTGFVNFHKAEARYKLEQLNL